LAPVQIRAGGFGANLIPLIRCFSSTASRVACSGSARAGRLEDDSRLDQLHVEDGGGDFTALGEAMPGEKWNFKPTRGAFSDARTIAEQVKHVACGNEAWARKLRAEKTPGHCDTGGPNPAKTKTEILACLRETKGAT
jgi:hypothetical protein